MHTLCHGIASEIPSIDLEMENKKYKELLHKFAEIPESDTKRDSFFVKDQLLWKLTSQGLCQVLKQNEKQMIFCEGHSNPFHGDMGIRSTTKFLKNRLWWPGMSMDIANFVKSCDICQ
jgi:hypothetical protein